MSTDWPDHEEDMEIATQIIHRFVEDNGGQPLRLLPLEENHDTQSNVPEWIIELYAAFIDKYGIEEGQEITSRIVTKCLLLGETIH